MATSSITLVTVETLLNLLVVEWQKCRRSPMGVPISGVKSNDHSALISLRPLIMDEGCPRNFNDFYSKAKLLSGLENRKVAFEWYSRTRLYYGCSSVCVIFTEFVVPELMRRGINTLPVSSFGEEGSDTIHLKNIKIKEIKFTPINGKVHTLRMTYAIFPPNDFHVEMGSHNALHCSETDRIFDPSIGQLTGVMKPKIVRSEQQYVDEFPGNVIIIYDSPQSDIEAQKLRDANESRIHKNAEIHPSRIAKRVVDAFLSSNDTASFCDHCLGLPSSGSKLLRCGNCKSEYYCGKSCQVIAWKSHRTKCQVTLD